MVEILGDDGWENRAETAGGDRGGGSDSGRARAGGVVWGMPAETVAVTAAAPDPVEPCSRCLAP